LAKVNWDEPLPSDVRQQWLNIEDKLPLINGTEIDRVAVSNGKKGKLRCMNFQIEAQQRKVPVCVRPSFSQGNIIIRLL
jgi:hypothetical protein